MKNQGHKSFLKLSLMPLLFMLNTACVVTPDGDLGVVGGVGVDINPQIVYSDNSFVTVRVGPSFYASDAYLVAYNYCLDRGLYAYEYSSWDHSANIVRELRYDCRPNYIAPPIVFNVDRRNRYRYSYFQDYYRHHRPGYHYRTEPSRGWWGRGNNNNHHNHTNNSRPPIYNSPGYSRDGRAVTPQSPWSYNGNKNRYQPRSGDSSRPPVSQPVNSSPGWWGKSNNSSSNGSSGFGSSSSSISSPRNESPRYDVKKDRDYTKEDARPNNRFEPAPSRGNSSSGGSSGFGSSSSSSSPKSSSPSSGGSPGWWGKK